jgi:uncharacterized protein (DUF1697 family)
MRQIILLRGINLGAHRRVSMRELREVLTRGGFEDVRTYLQSGNVVLTSDLTPDELTRKGRRLIAKELGLEIDVVVRTRDELAEVVRRNPLRNRAVDPKRYQVSFLAQELDPEVLDELAAAAVPPEELVAIGRELYAWHPAGVARSRLWSRLAGKGLGVVATARNWTTVESLLALADE